MKKWRQLRIYLISICGEVWLETETPKDVNEVKIHVTEDEVMVHGSIGSTVLVATSLNLFLNLSSIMQAIKKCWEGKNEVSYW